MPFYENVFIVRPDASPQQVENLAARMETLIKDQGGDVPKTEFWGLKSLAYKIKKNRKGHYVHMNVDAPSEAVGELERSLRLNEDILRFMSIRVEKLDRDATAMMRNKSNRDDRSIRRGGARKPAAEGITKPDVAATPATPESEEGNAE